MTKEVDCISDPIYFLAFAIFLFAMLIVFKLTNIQCIHGAYYRKKVMKHIVKNYIE